MFPEEVLSKDGFEVLKGLLTCDPKKRLTAAAALWNMDDGRPSVISVAAPAISKAGAAMATTVWSQVVAGVGRALGLLRPKALLNLNL
ncbi:putative cyclin-dependent kinase F-2 [Panicum miliaceum]|uniref:Cyclin-dependent kinase F-2 n=1 Tax=Panicum miliaceum TaxID=4540 RepID=A0A3L6SXQ4_PANMI|nr:putative cyclin-dependent kinase F-2 [Panicum miliaceum]